MNLEIISILVFFALVGILIIKDRKNIQFSYGLVTRRWKKGKEKIDKFAKKHKKLLAMVGNLAIIVGIGASLVTIYFLVKFTLEMKAGLSLVLPTAAGYQIPGPVFSVPFWYWIIGIFVLIASHETMHAIFARTEKIPIKNYGVMLFFFFPLGAFVDLNMEKIKKLKLKKKLRIFAAGSFGNFLVGLIVFLLLLASAHINNGLMEPVGLKFEPIPETPAGEVNLSGTIYQINNQTIKNTIDLENVLNQTKVGDDVTILTTTGNFTLKTTEHPEVEGRAYLGIKNIREVYKYKLFFSGHVSERVLNSILIWYQLLFWVFLLNVGVGMFNLLPIKPLDGGLMFEEISKKFFGKKGKTIATICSIVILVIILMNLFGISLIRSLG